MDELRFETELIQYLCHGAVSSAQSPEADSVAERPVDYVVKTKLWKYEPDIKTTDHIRFAHAV